MTRRIFLPVVDRRVVLRGLAATLVASLTGCRISLDHPESPSEPDAAPGDHDSSVASDAGPGFTRCGDQLCIDLRDPANATLQAPDGARLITAGANRLLVIRIAETSFVTLSAICTHAGCTVRYSTARGDVECPCHGSTFDVHGTVTHGPAGTPLAVFATSYDAATDVVTIAL